MKQISRRDFLKLGGLSLLTSGALSFEGQYEKYKEQPIIYQGSSHFKRVALTVDDCYLVTMLQKLEEILDRHPEAKVTLFPVGKALLNNQQKDPGIWNRFYNNGHEIGYHSYDHTNPQVVSPENLVADFDQWLNALREVLDEEPSVRFARPPFGNASPSFLQMCKARGVVPTLWSTGWGGETENVVKYTVPKIKNGDIVLLHTRKSEIEATAQALPILAEFGIQPVTMSRLYLDWLLEQNETAGCYADPFSLSRTCIE